MEALMEAPRRTRPPRAESSSSGTTRMTPQSSNTSSNNLPLRQVPAQAQGQVQIQAQTPRAKDLGGAGFLQERIRERKGEGARSLRKSLIGVNNTENDLTSSPVRADEVETRPESNGRIASNPIKKNLGVKQIEEQVSSLHKQNFDLKLELFHRRERQKELEARLETTLAQLAAKLESEERQLAEQQELREINDQLLAELEKRDQAVEEAVGIIVNLEERVDAFQQEREDVQRLITQYEAGAFRATLEDASSLLEPPVEGFGGKPPTKPKSINRMPSFLSEKSEGAEALRSLYLSSDAGLPALSEEPASRDGFNSPRLSVLSESSFRSIYGDKTMNADAVPSHAEVEVALSQSTHRRTTSVEKWLDERQTASAEKVLASASNRANMTRQGQFSTIQDVLGSPLQRLEKLKYNMENQNAGLNTVPTSVRKTAPPEASMLPKNKMPAINLSNVRDTTDQYHKLPPTPDTISTSTLRRYKNSSDTLAPAQSHTSIEDRTSLMTSSAVLSQAIRRDDQPALLVRPRSAGETIISRRDGYGWDGETNDATDTWSLSSGTSAYSGPLPSGIKRSMAPERLFGRENMDEDILNWGRNAEPSSEPSMRLPLRLVHRYDVLQALDLPDEPRSDDTITEYGTNFSDFDYSHESPVLSAMHSSPKYHVPARRASLSAKTSQQSHPTVQAGQNTSTNQQINLVQMSKESKRFSSSRFTGKLFGLNRSEGAASANAPPLNGLSNSVSTPSSLTSSLSTGQVPNLSLNLQANQSQVSPFRRAQTQASMANTTVAGDRYADDDGSARATPPPIRRNRGAGMLPPSGVGPGHAGRRPRSAGIGMEAVEVEPLRPIRRPVPNVDLRMEGNLITNVVEASTDEAVKPGGIGRKWFGGLRR